MDYTKVPRILIYKKRASLEDFGVYEANTFNAVLYEALMSLDDFDLTRDEALKLLKIAVKTIFVDDDYKYSEVKFFRATRLHLKTIDNDDILNNIPEIDDFWLEPDIQTDNIEKDYFDSVEIPLFNLTEIK